MTSSSAFAMTHRMSLAKITLKYKAGVVTTKNYTWNTSSGTASIQNSGTTNVMASKSFSTTSSYVKPYYHTTESNQEIYYYVAKYNEKPQLIDNDATEYKKWTSAITIQNASSQALGKGNYAAFTATSRAENRAWCYYVGTFSYASSAQKFTTPIAGSYQIECWGASGGTVQATGKKEIRGGYGAYTKGTIQLTASKDIYVYTGEMSAKNTNNSSLTFNGGGGSYGHDNSTTEIDGRGGGATDVSVNNGVWNSDTHKYSRIMVAGAGGGATTYETSYTGDGTGGNAGGLNGYPGNLSYAIPTSNWPTSKEWASNPSVVRLAQGGTQTAGGLCWYFSGTSTSNHGGGQNGGFGYGGTGTNEYPGFNPGGGSGWYGGGSSGVVTALVGTGAGGSSFISNHPGCVSHASYRGSATNIVKYQNVEYKFESGTTQMIDGSGHAWTSSTAESGYTLMPNPSGGSYGSGVGHTGNGYARITFVSE